MKANVKITTTGFSGREVAAEFEKQIRDKLRSNGLGNVRVKVSERGEVALDANTQDELDRAARVLDIKQ